MQDCFLNQMYWMKKEGKNNTLYHINKRSGCLRLSSKSKVRIKIQFWCAAVNLQTDNLYLGEQAGWAPNRLYHLKRKQKRVWVFISYWSGVYKRKKWGDRSRPYIALTLQMISYISRVKCSWEGLMKRETERQRNHLVRIQWPASSIYLFFVLRLNSEFTFVVLKFFCWHVGPFSLWVSVSCLTHNAIWLPADNSTSGI